MGKVVTRLTKKPRKKLLVKQSWCLAVGKAPKFWVYPSRLVAFAWIRVVGSHLVAIPGWLAACRWRGAKFSLEMTVC